MTARLRADRRTQTGDECTRRAAAMSYACAVIEKRFRKLQAMNLRAHAPTLLPRATDWLRGVSAMAERDGIALTDGLHVLARRVGVRQPQRIRLLTVAELPQPTDPQLCAAARAIGLLGEGMRGIAAGYGVLLLRGQASTRLLSHEFRHVRQFELAGSIEGFLSDYLPQVAIYGPADAPLEVDAMRHETDFAQAA